MIAQGQVAVQECDRLRGGIHQRDGELGRADRLPTRRRHLVNGIRSKRDSRPAGLSIGAGLLAIVIAQRRGQADPPAGDRLIDARIELTVAVGVGQLRRANGPRLTADVEGDLGIGLVAGLKGPELDAYPVLAVHRAERNGPIPCDADPGGVRVDLRLQVDQSGRILKEVLHPKWGRRIRDVPGDLHRRLAGNGAERRLWSPTQRNRRLLGARQSRRCNHQTEQQRQENALERLHERSPSTVRTIQGPRVLRRSTPRLPPA